MCSLKKITGQQSLDMMKWLLLKLYSHLQLSSSSLDICKFTVRRICSNRKKKAWSNHLGRRSILCIVYEVFTPTFAAVSSTPSLLEMGHMEVIILCKEWNYRENGQMCSPPVTTQFFIEICTYARTHTQAVYFHWNKAAVYLPSSRLQ